MKCWLHSSSELAAPSRASVSAPKGFPMQGLAPAWRGWEMYPNPSITHPSQACPLQQHRTLLTPLAIVPFAHQLVQFQRSNDGENDSPGWFFLAVSPYISSPAPFSLGVLGSQLSQQRWGG